MPDEWQKSFEGEFESDRGRDAVISAIRDHTAGGSSNPLLRVYGDAGVGVSRTVFEAIGIDGIRERTLVSTDGGKAIAEVVAHDPAASVVLVVDPATERDVDDLQPFVGAASGRLIVVALLNPDPAAAPPPGHLLVRPLERAAVRRLLDPANKGAKADEALATLAGGYPGLALQIRSVVQRQGPGAELVAVARGRLTSLLHRATIAV